MPNELSKVPRTVDDPEFRGRVFALYRGAIKEEFQTLLHLNLDNPRRRDFLHEICRDFEGRSRA